MKDRAQAIIETAAQKGVCRTGKRYLKQTPKDAATLIKLMKAWPEYIQEHPDSALHIFRENMTDELQAQLVAANIFIDYQCEATIGSDTAVIVMGGGRITINTAPFAVTNYLFNSTQPSSSQGQLIIDLEAWNEPSIGIKTHHKSSQYNYASKGATPPSTTTTARSI